MTRTIREFNGYATREEYNAHNRSYYHKNKDKIRARIRERYRLN